MSPKRIYTCRRQDGRVVRMYSREDGWFTIEVSTIGDRYCRTVYAADSIAYAYREYNRLCAGA